MKKNIDKLFKENFNNQEIAPPEMVWTNIERELKKKKEKKIIPIWWKYSGVAAILLIGIFIGKEFFGSTENNSVPVNTVEVSSNSNSNIESNENAKIPEISNENEVLVADSNDKNVPSNEINFQNKNDSKVEMSTISNNNLSSRAQSRDKLNKNSVKNKSFTRDKKSEIVSNDLSSQAKLGNQSNINKESSEMISNNNNSSSNKSNEKIVLNDENIKIKPEKEKIENLNNNYLLAKKQVASSEKIAIKKDSIAKKPNVLENLLAEKNKKKTKQTDVNKWQITPNFAPIYANSISNNSTFDSKFNNNSKSNERNISLGLAVNYSVSKKISIRSGINKFDVGTNTNNIGYYKYGATANGANDATALLFSDYAISNNLQQLPEIKILETSVAGLQNSTFIPNPITKTEGIINQKSSYIEVPLEISFAIINKKIGINLITGFSTLFLNKNQVSLVSNIENIDLGQSDNLNKIHYSTNIGLGFNYKFAKSFQVNVEPMLKYQINAFKNDFQNNKPYFLGIYSGISFGF